MRHAVRWAIRLYPAAWRERYGTEFEALLEDVRPGGRELRDILRGAMKMRLTVWSWQRTAAAFALAGAIVAGVVSLRTQNDYVSTTVMRLPEGGADRLQQAQTAVLSRPSLAAIIMREELYPEERTRLPLEEIVMGMRNRSIRMARRCAATSASGRPVRPRACKPSRCRSSVEIVRRPRL